MRLPVPPATAVLLFGCRNRSRTWLAVHPKNSTGSGWLSMSFSMTTHQTTRCMTVF